MNQTPSSTKQKFVEDTFGLPALTGLDGQANDLYNAFDFAQKPLPPLILQQRTCPALSVTITSPTNGSIVSHLSTVTITASVSDRVAATKVEFYVNGSLLCTDTTIPYTCAWSVPAKPNASYTLMAKAYDAAHDTATSSVTVTSSH